MLFLNVLKHSSPIQACIFYLRLILSSCLKTVNVLLCHYQPVILDYLASKTICSDDLVVVSPDVGGVARARAFAKKLSDAPLAIVDKRRHGHNVAEVF
jgi:phosphoribosylpyrophosphate synthetase